MTQCLTITVSSDEEALVLSTRLLLHSAWTSNSVFTYATSLPKEISFRPRSSFAIAQQIDEDESDDLERIGKSFRELSQSLMCTDGTELFGDLPSPRLNARAT